MNHLLKYILFSFLLTALSACTKGVNETVESAYMLPVLPEPVYKFSRNGDSSVKLLECDFLKSPIDRIFAEYMNRALMGREQEYDNALRMYNNGIFGLKPQQEVSASPTHSANRETVLKEVEGWLLTSAQISGMGAEIPSEHRGREAVKGASGYVGNNIGDKDICFVNEKGIAVAEVFKYAMMGAVYMDKILNTHLNKQLLEDKEILARHNLTQLVIGNNYTELEHHWDLAYGYYRFWKSLAQSDGLPALKNAHLRIFNSFVKGRTYMETFRYDEMRLQADTIRHELSRVVAVRAMNLLVGSNTYANLNENPKRAFRLLSQAYGMIYAAQFTCNAEWKPFITNEETTNLLKELEQGNGLWDKERLMKEEKSEGSLQNLAARIGKTFGISLEEIKK